MPWKHEPMVANQTWKWTYEQPVQPQPFQPAPIVPSYQEPTTSNNGNNQSPGHNTSKVSKRGLLIGLATVGVVIAGTMTGGLAIGAAFTAGTIGAGAAAAMGSGIAVTAGAVGGGAAYLNGHQGDSKLRKLKNRVFKRRSSRR